MGTKFGRRYRLTIHMTDDPEIIIIEPPFTIQFNIERGISSSQNTMLLEIYNLGEVLRNRIYQDPWTKFTNNVVILEAGYNNLSVIFTGYIQQASSVRQGSDIVTTISAFDGFLDLVNTQSSKTMAAGALNKDVIQTLIGDFKNLNLGAIGDFAGEFKRPVVLNGNTYVILKQYTNNACYVDLGKVYALQDNEVIGGDIPVIDSSTGLLQTPQRSDAYLNILTIFEPEISLSQVIQLSSEVLPLYDGQYKVIGITHSGIISEAIGGQCTSRFTLLLNNSYFGKFNIVQPASTTVTA